MPRFIFDRYLFLAHFLAPSPPLFFSTFFLELSFNFALFVRDIVYSFHPNRDNGSFEHSHYFRNARWSCCVLWRLITTLYSFLSKHHPWEQRFYLISQCCNLLEMKAILKYSTCCEPCFTRLALKVCVSFYCRCTRTWMKLSVAASIYRK